MSFFSYYKEKNSQFKVKAWFLWPEKTKTGEIANPPKKITKKKAKKNGKQKLTGGKKSGMSKANKPPKEKTANKPKPKATPKKPRKKTFSKMNLNLSKKKTKPLSKSFWENAREEFRNSKGNKRINCLKTLTNSLPNNNKKTKAIKTSKIESSKNSPKTAPSKTKNLGNKSALVFDEL